MLSLIEMKKLLTSIIASIALIGTGFADSYTTKTWGRWTQIFKNGQTATIYRGGPETGEYTFTNVIDPYNILHITYDKFGHVISFEIE
jgi:hypothetical protein